MFPTDSSKTIKKDSVAARRNLSYYHWGKTVPDTFLTQHFFNRRVKAGQEEISKFTCKAHTCFEKHNLIILTQFHKSVNAFGKLHHILYSFCDFDGTQLPHHLSLLQRSKAQQHTWSPVSRTQVFLTAPILSKPSLEMVKKKLED